MNMARVLGVGIRSINRSSLGDGDTLSTSRAVSRRARDAIVEELGNSDMGTATQTLAGASGEDVYELNMEEA
jgi:hypothetical protein